MVTGWLLTLLSHVASFFIGLLDFPDPPAFFDTLPDKVASFTSWLSGSDAYIPWAVGAAVLAAYGLSLASGVIVKGVRIVASFLTLGGGSAA